MTCLPIACGRDAPSSEQRFETWRAQAENAAAADAYRGFLHSRGVDGIVPMPQLLRSGRSWRPCGSAEFVVPPRDAWAAMVPTLDLVRDLRKDGQLAGAVVASSYRDAAFNHCEGGSSRSRHRINNALVFDLPASSDASKRIASLCGYWRARGAQHRVGLGFYDDRKIHLDTSGFRTWGSDYTHRTSLCVANAPDGVEAQRVKRLL